MQECWPPEDTADDTWHVLTYADGFPYARLWRNKLWWQRSAHSGYTPAEQTKLGYTYLHPVKMPRKRLSREAMENAAKNWLADYELWCRMRPDERSYQMVPNETVNVLRRIAGEDPIT